jgi:hypothetical protein
VSSLRVSVNYLFHCPFGAMNPFGIYLSRFNLNYIRPCEANPERSEGLDQEGRYIHQTLYCQTYRYFQKLILIRRLNPMLSFKPATKNSLIAQLHQTQIEKIDVREPTSKKDIKDLAKDIQTFAGNFTKPVAVILLKGR